MTSESSDPRSEIEEELAAHLERAEQECVSQGMSPEAARAEALRRFGDPQKYLKSCWGQAPEARMKKALGIALAVAVVAMGLGLTAMGFQLSRTHERLDKIMAILAETKQHQGAQEGPQAQVAQSADLGEGVRKAFLDNVAKKAGLRTAEVSENPGVVYVDGVCVKRPGVYALPPQGELTVTRLIAVSAVDLRPGWWAYVVRVAGDRAQLGAWKSKGYPAWESDAGMCFAVPLPSPGEPALVDFALKSGDHVTISEKDYTEFKTPKVGSAQVEPGTATIVGQVRNPGIYNIVRGDFLLQNLVTLAGGAAKDAKGVMVWRKPGDWASVDLPTEAIRSPNGDCVAFPIGDDQPAPWARSVFARAGDTVLVSEKFPDFGNSPRVAMDQEFRLRFELPNRHPGEN